MGEAKETSRPSTPGGDQAAGWAKRLAAGHGGTNVNSALLVAEPSTYVSPIGRTSVMTPLVTSVVPTLYESVNVTVVPSSAVGSDAVEPSGSSSSSIGALLVLAIVRAAPGTSALSQIASMPVALTQAVFR